MKNNHLFTLAVFVLAVTVAGARAQQPAGWTGWTRVCDGQERSFPTTDADRRIGQIREENAAVTAPRL